MHDLRLSRVRSSLTRWMPWFPFTRASERYWEIALCGSCLRRASGRGRRRAHWFRGSAEELALALQELGEDEAAREHFRAMLKLNGNDNQGIRYLLLASLLRCGDLAGAKALLASYADDWSAQWLYTRALIAYRDGHGAEAATLKLVKEARSANGHVPAILARTRPPVLTQTGYITMGGPDEATDYVREFGQAWKDTPGAIAGSPRPRTLRPQSTAPANGTPDRLSVQFRANGQVTP